ncbi:hypothetical protein BB560_000888 [Smittium megazygosporum]|uniref:Uncharacterized protein n=1 Tax=Smittium megazygosporum TaxID=133381 RepID=A0A2T9ZJ59_9FUNG|nr:hypothetical protein BB560_000888 [Smittium megazygosporum]
MPKSKTSSKQATIATFFVSAWWHGFYLAYYVSFIAASFVSNTSRLLYRSFNPYYEDPTFLGKAHGIFRAFYYIIGVALTSLSTSFEVIPFSILDVSGAFRIWGSFYYAFPIGLVLNVLFFDFLGGAAVFAELNKQRVHQVKKTDNEKEKLD